MATAVVERHDFSAGAAIEHDRPLQNCPRQLPAVDQFMIPGSNVPGIAEKDSVVRHDTIPVSEERFFFLLCHLLCHGRALRIKSPYEFGAHHAGPVA
jgi:hypothetical protein